MATTDLTNITPPRVPLIDPRTGLISREWYRFFLNIFQLVGSGQNTTSLTDLQLGPPPLAQEDLNNIIIDVEATKIQPTEESAIEQIAELQKQVEGLAAAPAPALGTFAALQQDNLPWTTFDTTPESVPTTVGTLAWDGGTTLGLQATTGVTIRIGESEFIYAKASSAITKGQLCYHTGSVGGSGVITTAPTPLALTDPNQIVGVAAESIALNGFGLIQISGDLRGFNTTGSSVGETWADGDPLYYNPAYVGSFTKTKPSAPNQKTYIGEVINASSGGSGSINVRIIPGSVLGGTDSNVQFGTVNNGDLIQYDSGLGYWKNVPASTLPVGTATNLAGGLAGSVPYQSAPSTTTFLGIGVAGRWLGSSGTAPQWNAPAALTKTDDTNVTLTLGGSASTALLNAASLTLGWTGQLAVGRGGTGLSSYTVNGVLYASGATTLANGSGFTTDGVNVSQIGTSPLLTLQDSASSNNSRLLLQAQSGAVYISTTYSSSNIPMIFSFGGTSTGTEVFRITTAGKLNVTGLTASKVVFTDASKDLTSTGTVGADQGGTGQSSYTTGDLLYATGATALSKLGIGASTTILTSSGTAPQWSSASGLSVGTATNLAGGSAGSLPYQTGAGATTMLGIGASGRWLGSSGTAPQWNSPAALTKTDDTNVTLTLGGSASTALLNAASLTLGWTGQLAVTRGGTGLSTVAQGDILYGSASNTLAALAKNTSATRYLSNTGTSNNPAWAQVDLSNGVTGTLPVTNGGTGLASLTANRVLYASATNTVGTSANFLYDGTNLILGRTTRSSSEILTVESATARTAYFINTHATNGDIGVVFTLGANTNNTSSYHLYCVTDNANVFNIYGNGTYATVSDANLKKNIASARNGYLEDLCKLRVVKYNWITQDDGEAKELGFIAQELETVFPGLVEQGERNKMVKVSVLIPMLVKALQEMKQKFDDYVAAHP